MQTGKYKSRKMVFSPRVDQNWVVDQNFGCQPDIVESGSLMLIDPFLDVKKLFLHIFLLWLFYILMMEKENKKAKKIILMG